LATQKKLVEEQSKRVAQERALAEQERETFETQSKLDLQQENWQYFWAP
jgi:hypothetical protein